MTRFALACCVVAALLSASTEAESRPAAGVQEPAGQVQVAPDGVTQELVLLDGSRMYGRVTQVDGDRITFRTIAGATLEVAADQIVSLRTVVGEVSSRAFGPADPNPTRLFFGPTGRSLPAGSAYLGLYMFAMPFVQVGVTDRFSVGGGTPLFFGGGANHPFWITPKLQVVARPRVQASVGAMHFLNVDDGHFGVAYSAVTMGSPDTALTVAGGYAYLRSSDFTSGAGVGMVGFEHRISPRGKFITENYVFSDQVFSMAGFRFLGERLSADLGLVVPIGADHTFVFPMANFVWRFGR